MCSRWCALLVAAVTVAFARGAPHIVIIMADDMGWNDVSFHGSNQILTPNIDALAYKGVILNRHYTSPSCSPSRSSLLTGHYAAHTGMQRPIGAGTSNALSLNFTLLPQFLSRLGYQSHLVGKWHLGSHRTEYLPTRRGFDSHFGFWHGLLGFYDGIHVQSDMAGLDAHRNDAEAWQEFVGRYITDVLTEEAVSVVNAHENVESPLFLQIALSAPHAGNKGSEFQVRNLTTNEEEHAHIADLHRRLYAGMVRGVDDSVGAILEALRSRDMLNNSIVIFMSDNGAPTLDPQFGYNNYGSNWPLRGMKLSCHEGGVRNVAALWSSLVPGGRVSDQLIHIVDWLPTLYSAAGGDVRDLGEMDGLDQWQALRSVDARAGERTEMLVDLDDISGNEAVIKWPWKLIKYNSNSSVLNEYAGESGRGPEVPEYSMSSVTESLAAQALLLDRSATELSKLRAKATIDQRCSPVDNSPAVARPCAQRYCLFNLLADPCESSDLSDSNPGVVASLRQALDRYQTTKAPRTLNIPDPRANPALSHNYWTTWAEDISSGKGSRTTLSFMFSVVILPAVVVRLL